VVICTQDNRRRLEQPSHAKASSERVRLIGVVYGLHPTGTGYVELFREGRRSMMMSGIYNATQVNGGWAERSYQRHDIKTCSDFIDL